MPEKKLPVLASFEEPKEYRKFIARYFDEYCEKKLQQSGTGNVKLSILCIGALYIDEYLSDWIKTMSEKKQFDIDLHIFRDEKITQQFKHPTYYPPINILKEIKAYSNIRHSLKKTSIDKDLPLEIEYDIIINLYHIHNALNWRLLIIRLLRQLKNDGIFLFSDVEGTYSIVDGNFKDFPNNEAAGIKLFDNKRNEDCHFWRPELSLTNYSVLKTQVEGVFDKIVDRESVPATAENWEKGIISHIKINEGYTLKKLIEDRNFAYFLTGINEEETEEIVEAVNKNGLLEKDCSVLNRQDQLYMCLSFNRQRFLNIKERHWNYNTLIKDIDHIKDNSIRSLGRKVLDIFTSHDVFFPGYTKAIGLISWDSEWVKNWSYPLHLVTSEKNIQDKITRYLPLLNESKLKLLQLIFKESANKYPIYIAAVATQDFEQFANEKYTSISFGDKKFAYYVEKTRKDKIERISLLISDSMIAETINRNESLCKQFEEDHSRYPGRIEEINLKMDGIYRYTIEEKKEAVDTESNPAYEIDCYNFTVNDEKFAEIIQILQESLINGKTIVGGITEPILEWIITLTVLFQLRETGTRVGFIPSAIIANIDESHAPEISITGLGGAILLEKLPHPGDLLIGGLFAARDKAVEEAVNLVFYKASIASHINKGFYKKALNSAGAAITARSGSHTLGSHVLPEIIGKLSELTYKAAEMEDPFTKLYALLENFEKDEIENIKEEQNEINIFCREVNKLQDNTKYLTNEIELFKYLQERLDYITQIVGDYPQWSLSMNFATDLMKRFYQQSHILNSLGDTEGLSAYIYTPKDKPVQEYIEADWLDETPLTTAHIGKHITVYSHCIPIGNSLVFVNTKFQATMLLHNPFLVENPEFPIIVCQDFDTKKRRSPLEIIREGFEEFDFYGQKIKIGGKVVAVDGKRTILSNCKVYGNRLVLKIRYRKFLYVNDHFEIINHKNYSETLSQQLDCFLDIGNKNIDKLLEDVEIDIYSIFLGVIQSIGGPDGENKYQVNLFCSKKYSFHLTLDNSALQGLNNSPYIKEEKLHLKKDVCCIGARIIIHGRLQKGSNKNEFSIIGRDSETALIKEISYIDYITTTSSIIQDNSRDFEDIKIAVPGGSVGTQAFYIILENIIRNAAKHNWIHIKDFYKEGKNMEVKIELEERHNRDYYICKIWTNTTNLEYADARPFNDEKLLYFINNPKNLNSQINERLVGSIIEHDGSLKRSNLGLSEIRICAAFLARHQLINKGTLYGGEVLFDDKGNNAPNGFIKCSMMLEEDAGELVPRLGYRIKLLKPKDLLIIDYPGKDEGKNGNKHNGSVDYQLCVFYTTGKTRNFGNDVIDLVDLVLDNKVEYKEIDQRLYALSRTIENYPCRLFIITEKAKGNDKWNRFFTDYNPLSGDIINKLGFLRNRIRFIDTETFEKAHAKGEKELEIKLYQEWCLMFASKEHNYELEIQQGTKNFFSTYHPSVTVPVNLRPPANHIINEKIKKQTTLVFDRGSQKTFVVKYTRHSNEKKHQDPNKRYLYSEGISGASKIFSLIKNYRSSNEYLTAKLMENGLCNIMIIDERVMKYVHNEKANREINKNDNLYNTFQHLNIILPYKIKINEKVIYEAELNLDEVKVDGDKKVIDLSFSEDRNVTIYFLQPSNTSSPNSYRINSLVIHQTMLDYFAKGLFPKSGSTLKEAESVNKVILRLKHDANIPCVIITSGRGPSTNSSSYAKFIPFSDISHLLLRKDPDKYTLTQILLQSLNIAPNKNE